MLDDEIYVENSFHKFSMWIIQYLIIQNRILYSGARKYNTNNAYLLFYVTYKKGVFCKSKFIKLEMFYMSEKP